jgi:hypothetical protein
MPPSPLPRSTIDNPGVQYSPISPIDGFPAQYSSENTRFEALETRGSIRRFWRNTRNVTENSLHRYMNWEEEGHEPYHEYVHQLVDAGWDNLKGLDDYMSDDWEDRDLIRDSFSGISSATSTFSLQQSDIVRHSLVLDLCCRRPPLQQRVMWNTSGFQSISSQTRLEMAGQVSLSSQCSTT